MTAITRGTWAQAGLVALLSVPFAILAFDLAREIREPGVAFGPDPAETIVRYLGEWAIRILLATLAVSPAARLLRRPRLVRYRRTFGLTAFAYVVAHFAAYLALLAGLDAGDLPADFADRPYITVGLAALALLIPLGGDLDAGLATAPGTELAAAAPPGVRGRGARLRPPALAVEGGLHGRGALRGIARAVTRRAGRSVH